MFGPEYKRGTGINNLRRKSCGVSDSCRSMTNSIASRFSHSYRQSVVSVLVSIRSVRCSSMRPPRMV